MPTLTFPQTLERIGRDDALDAVKAYVTGACVEHEQVIGIVYGPGWYGRNIDQVWLYLNGQAQIDASYGDFTAVTCHKAAKVFGWPEERRLSSNHFTIEPQRDAILGMTWDQFVDKVYEEITSNRFVNAIKTIRVRYQIGLYEAKAMMEIVRDGRTGMDLYDLKLAFEAGRMREYYTNRLVIEMWTPEVREAAIAEGWNLIYDQGQWSIGKIFDPDLLVSDNEALSLVKWGNKVHHGIACSLMRRLGAPL